MSGVADLGAILGRDPVQAKELDKEGMWVLLHVLKVFGEQLQQQLHLTLHTQITHMNAYPKVVDKGLATSSKLIKRPVMAVQEDAPCAWF